MDRRHLAVSAQQLDPLSWFTGRVVPLVFGALIVLYGAFRIPTWFQTPMPWLQPLAVVLCAGACVGVYVMTRSMRPQLGWSGGIITVAVAGAGLIISAIGYAGTPLSIELWWAPFGLGVAISSLSPYLSAPRVLLLGGIGTVITTVVAFWVLEPTIENWGPVSAMIIIASPVLCGVIASVTFAYVLVSRMLPIIEQRSRMMLQLDPVDAGAEQIERLRLARLTARAVPFIEGIARSGEISTADRALAGQLARRVRDDLVTQSNLSWLDSISSDSRLVVVDPEHRASRMRPSQRTALRALLRAVLETPGADSTSMLIELRGRPDGATAVAISMDVELPEGRRIMHIAPHLLTLRTAVDDLTWDARSMNFVVRE